MVAQHSWGDGKFGRLYNNDKACSEKTVHVGWVIAILGMDEVIEIVVRDDNALLRCHQELVLLANAMIAPPGPCGVDTKISPEMQQLFEHFIIRINEVAFQVWEDEEEPFEISVFPPK